MGRGKESLLRRQSFPFSLEEISLKERILRNDRSGHQVDRSPQMPIAPLREFTHPDIVS